MLVKNPIIQGFSPDPCICKDNNYYYIATSTFEWYPGGEIYRSADLVNWELVSRPLIESSYFNLKGIPDSGGVWAPSLSYADGKFWLMYTISKGIDGIFKDVDSYLVMADDVCGKWSDPIYINSSGVNPSLFHDEDGKKYVVNSRTLNGGTRFSGILLQEYDVPSKKMIGEPTLIFEGSAAGGTEGSHLLKKDDYYYLITAEGGVGRHHSMIVARSRNIEGPYEVSPYSPLITTLHDEVNSLKEAGHGNLIEGPDGWYLVHSCSIYLSKRRQVCPLSRQTAIQNIAWENNWPHLSLNRYGPSLFYEVPGRIQQNKENSYETYFAEEKLDLGWMSLRTPGKYQLLKQPNRLRVLSGDSLTSLSNQSLLARKWESTSFIAKAKLSFYPKTYQQMAGIVCYYNTKCWIFLYVSHDEITGKRMVNILINDNTVISEPLSGLYGHLPDEAEEIYLQFTYDEGVLRCSYSYDGGEETILGQHIDGSILSDEHVAGWAYTGATVGLTVIDTASKGSYADFSYFSYQTDVE